MGSLIINQVHQIYIFFKKHLKFNKYMNQLPLYYIKWSRFWQYCGRKWYFSWINCGQTVHFNTYLSYLFLTSLSNVSFWRNACAKPQWKTFMFCHLRWSLISAGITEFPKIFPQPAKHALISLSLALSTHKHIPGRALKKSELFSLKSQVEPQEQCCCAQLWPPGSHCTTVLARPDRSLCPLMWPLRRTGL